MAQAAEKLRVGSLEPIVLPLDEFQIPVRSPCPYCENFAGRYGPNGPPALVVEDRLTVVYLAPAPMGGMPGHALVTTRRHVETIFDLASEEEAALAAALCATARAIRSTLAPAGILIQQNNRVAAFQTVPHIHFHVIPKVPGPCPPSQPPEVVPYEQRAELATRLRAHWPSAYGLSDGH